MSFEQITEPAEDVVGLEIMKNHLRVFHNADDEYIKLLIDACVEIIETKTKHIFIKRDFKAYFDNFGIDGELVLPLTPIKAVSDISYNYYGVMTSLDSGGYQMDLKRGQGRIRNAYMQDWPSVQRGYNGVEVTFTAGYDTAEKIPKKMLAALNFLVGHFYTNREPVLNGISVLSSKIPLTFEYVLGTFKYMSI